MQNQPELREELIVQYMPLVYRVVRRFQGWGPLDEDLLQAGRIGLNRAIEKYEPGRGVSFINFAYRWIKHHVERAAWQEYPSNGVSHRDYQLLRRSSAVRTKLTRELGREPTVEEMSSALKLPMERVTKLMVEGMPLLSLDELLEQDRSTREKAFTLARNENTPDKILELKELQESVRKAVNVLPRNEQAVISLRFGLDADTPRKFSDIAAELRVSTPRVKQIEKAALGRLRNSLPRRGH